MTRIEELRKQERQLTKLIRKWHKEGEFRFVLMYGTGGIGKTSYAMQCVKQVDPGYYKERFIFPPKQFVDTVSWLKNNNLRIPALVWDDMGFWMYTLDYNDPFVKSAVKFFNVARTVVSCIIGTTTSMKMLTSSVRNMDALTVKVVAARDNLTLHWLKAIGHRFSQTSCGWSRQYLKMNIRDTGNRKIINGTGQLEMATSMKQSG